MNINDYLKNASANTRSTGQAGATTQRFTARSSASISTANEIAATSPLSKADERVQKQVDSTKAQLSNLGVLKSSIAGLQTRSTALTSIPSDMTPSDVTTLMAKFFNAYNVSVSSAHAKFGIADGAEFNASSRKVAVDLRRAMSSNAEVSAAMKKLGLKVASDGTLSQDANKFADALQRDPSAVRGALKAVGTNVATVAARELMNGGNLESSMSSLDHRSTSLAAQQKAIRAYSL